jgi:hypothetical protein
MAFRLLDRLLLMKITIMKIIARDITNGTIVFNNSLDPKNPPGPEDEFVDFGV